MVSKIEWTERTWNPVRGCGLVSPGCHNCYAMRQAHRFSGPGKPYDGLTKLTNAGPQWTGVVRLVPEMLAIPLKTRQRTTWFVNSMSDLFHESLSNEDIAAVFGVMAACPQHTFQVLTKRAARMERWFTTYANNAPAACAMAVWRVPSSAASLYHWRERAKRRRWPLHNVHIGVSVEDQRRADERVPLLVQTPAALRFLSVEPLLGPVELTLAGIDWVIVGGESGPGARPCNVEWVRSVVKQCRETEVPCFVKQLGAKPFRKCDDCTCNGGEVRYSRGAGGCDSALLLVDRKGGDMSEWPDDLRVREMPRLVGGAP